jgi:Flp pilus assembly protein TadG
MGGERGSAVMEMALLSPAILFLFVGVLDWGFYSYALICTQAAARSAAEYASADAGTAADAAGACAVALGELRALPNIGNAVQTCGSNPVVTAAAVTGPDNKPATRVTVTYQTVSMIPIPGVLSGQITVSTSATMRLRATGS